MSCDESIVNIPTIDALNYMLFRIKGTSIVRKVLPRPEKTKLPALPFKLPFKKPFWKKEDPFGRFVIKIGPEFFLRHSQDLSLDEIDLGDEGTWPQELKDSPSWRHLVYCTTDMEGAKFVIELYNRRDEWKDLAPPPPPQCDLWQYVYPLALTWNLEGRLTRIFVEMLSGGLGPWPPPDGYE